MALTAIQQTLELIKNNKSILIVFKADWTGDALSGALSLAEALKKMDKKTTIVCDSFKPNASMSFLPTFQIQPTLVKLQNFIISIDTVQTKVGEFHYDQENNKLNIHLTPAEGQFKPADVGTSFSDYQYDLIITVNTPDLESLGKIYQEHTDFFYKTPKINLDHSYKNEHFGNINLVNLTSASTCEIVFDLIKNIDEKLIDENIATYLLAGIIMATKNFKVGSVTPSTLNLAGLLVAKGAKREQIIKNLYQSRYLSTLKLWGRVLSRLNNDLDDRLVWSVLSANDFLETSTNPDELSDVVDELIVSMPKTQSVVLLYEAQNKIHVQVYSANNASASDLCQKFSPVGNKDLAKFSLENTTLAEAEREVIEEVKNRLTLKNK
ncbi:MAG: DHH family phosphoesterase [bacterium]